tara:strand:- start:72 stop:374 length:303 start_codon:yes stop_codon:yes gene_type:complete
MNKLTLENVENGVTTSFAHLNLKTEETTFKIQTAGMGLAIKSIHSIQELRRLLAWLDEPSGNKRENGTFEKESLTNESEIRNFAKDMLKADKKLYEIKTL